jgi:molecular chaperone DnaK
VPDDELRQVADSVRDSRPPRMTPLPPLAAPPVRPPLGTIAGIPSPPPFAAPFPQQPPPFVQPPAPPAQAQRPMLSTQLLSTPPAHVPTPQPPVAAPAPQAPPLPAGARTQVLAAVQMPQPQQPLITQQPAQAFVAQPQVQAAPQRMPDVPLLIDVTPLSLSVETVGGYCDVVIDRNTPVPCERERMFCTVQNNQQSVKVRIAQGEGQKFAQNTLLGEVELSGLRSAPRGELQIAVVFLMDANGMLQVRARDVMTGQEAQAAIRLVTGQVDAAAMRARQDAQHIV